MKKYVNAFRMFFGRSNLSSMATFLITMAVMIVIVGALEFLTSGDFTAGMTAGMSIMLSAVVPLTGIIFVNALYSYANPATPGHKYFLSLPDSAEQFRRAVIAANVFTLGLGAALSAVLYGVFSLIRADIGLSFFGLVIFFAVLGICNFTGYFRNVAVRVLIISGSMGLTGFGAGFLSAGDEDEISFTEILQKFPCLMWAMLGTALLLFAAGLVYSVAVSRGKWVRE